jgi:hypothetical protein
MILYKLEPEVAGQRGEHTTYENLDAVRTKKERPIISHLHYEFEGWLGDEILESIANFIISEKLANDLIVNGLKGYSIMNVEISKTREFIELQPKTKLPKFKRMLPLGKVNLEGNKYKNWSGDDFCISQNNKLVVSNKALEVLKKHNLNHADITALVEEGEVAV